MLVFPHQLFLSFRLVAAMAEESFVFGESDIDAERDLAETDAMHQYRHRPGNLAPNCKSKACPDYK